jgi:hypothetical protein
LEGYWPEPHSEQNFALLGIGFLQVMQNFVSAPG